MILFVSGATKTIRQIGNHPNLGYMITPQSMQPERVFQHLPYVADNAAYSNWNEKKFLNMLWKITKYKNKPKFVACPDVVGDAKKTADRFDYWQPLLRELSLPVALVLQDGQEWIGVPNWKEFEVVFIGGSTKFKLGGWVREFIKRAKEHGKHIHMGRVNSEKRVAYAKKIGCDSIDGTCFSMFPDTYIPRFLRFLEKTQLQLF